LDKLPARLRSRDEAAYIQLMEKYSRLLWKIGWDILRDTADSANVEDCISEVFFKLWESPEKFDPAKGNIKNYLAWMMKNTAIDVLRKRSRENAETFETLENSGSRAEGALDAIIRKEDEQALRTAMSGLNDRDRELINRRYILDQKSSQISEEMRLPLREVENRLYRIKRRLRKQLTQTTD
jgi:RNA polymerase sigma-70 factor (ECF subfamily)